MSICKVAADCLINQGKREAERTIETGLAMCVVIAAVGSLPLAIASYGYKNDLVATVVCIETLALLIALSPICINQFISQLTLLTEGPLCSSLLSPKQIGDNLKWAVNELTHVAGFNQLLRDHLKTVFYYQGILRIALGITAIYHLLRMRRERKVDPADLGFILVSSAMVLDMGIVLALMGSGSSRVDTVSTVFKDCLKLNQTNVK